MEAVLQKILSETAGFYAAAGGALLVIRDGVTAVKECFGTADLETGRPVTEKSVFDLASASKSFTCTLIGTFCDEGVLDWDKPLRTWWPDFYLGDDYVSSHLTLRDMASHRSGLVSHNLIRWSLPEEIPDRKAYIDRISHLPLTAGFREKFLYQNELFAALGYLPETLTGKSYETLITERLAKPLGMDIAFRGLSTDLPDIAMPHKCLENGELLKIKHNSFWQNNPCGGLRTNLDSMEKWIRMMLGGGTAPDGTQILSEKTFSEFYKPNSVWCKPEEPNSMRLYSLGIGPSRYRGERLYSHGGFINGFRCEYGFFPDRNSAYFYVFNTDNDALQELFHFPMADLALGCLQEDYSRLQELFLKRFAAVRSRRAQPPGPVSAEMQSAFTGRWYNEAYHGLEIVPNAVGGLTLTYGTVQGELTEQTPGILTGNIGGLSVNADVRLAAPSEAVISFCEPYTPTPFRKLS